MKKMRCLRCLKEWGARIEKPSQCPWCGSYHIIDEETFERMVQTTEELIVKGLPARFPELDALRAVIRQFGLIQVLKADETLNLMDAILRELEKRHGPYWFMQYIIFGRKVG
jgi:DNA-directed RNA polymerase subunit RPC12/RpoP